MNLCLNLHNLKNNYLRVPEKIASMHFFDPIYSTFLGLSIERNFFGKWFKNFGNYPLSIYILLNFTSIKIFALSDLILFFPK
jgi:hypothetical protein